MFHCPKCNQICFKDAHQCPKCHTAFDKTHKEVVAQFGGVGGGNPQSWQPGSSPYSHQMVGGGGFNAAVDQGLDAYLSRTRKNTDYDPEPEKNVESRLELMHDYFEQDKTGYLPFKDRQKIKEQQKDQRKRQQEESDASLLQNSVPFINKYYFPDIKNVTPIEVSLDDTRLNPDARNSIYEDKIIVLDSEGKEHQASVKTSRVRHTVDTPFMNNDEEDVEENSDSLNPLRRQFNTFPLGNSGDILPGFSQSDVEKYLSPDNLDTLNGFLEEETIMNSYPGADEVSYPGEPKSIQYESTMSGDVHNTGLTTEEKLNNLKKQPSPTNLPQDPYQNIDFDKLLGQESVFTKYPSKDFALGYPAPLPRM